MARRAQGPPSRSGQPRSQTLSIPWAERTIMRFLNWPLTLLHRLQKAVGGVKSTRPNNRSLAHPPRAISRELGRRLISRNASKAKLIAYGERSEKAKEALLDHCESQPAIESVMTEFQITREDLRAVYDRLELFAAGVWESGHWVPASALVNPESLRYALMREDENDLVTGVQLRRYFKRGLTLEA